MAKGGRRVSIEYTVFEENGRKVDTNVGQKPLSFTFGADEVLPGLEEALVGVGAGETVRVTLPPEKSYGPVKPDAFEEVDPDLLPKEARRAGAVLSGRDEDGQERTLRVREVREDKIVVDHNHPLAGRTLTFEVKILSDDPV